MSLTESLVVGKPIPLSEDYSEGLQKATFWSNSVEMEKTSYFEDGDGQGLDVLIRFQCESVDDYNIRKRSCPTRNYISQILSKYISSIFRNFPNRVWSDTLVEIAKDINLEGTDANSFFQSHLETALTKGASYVLIDSTSDVTGFISELDKELNGDRLFLRSIPLENVLNKVEIEGNLIEVIITFEREDGNYARWYDKTSYIEMKLKKNKSIETMSEPIAHGFKGLPIVRLKPLAGEESFISPLAESQKTIHNLLSLVTQELTDQTFSKWLFANYQNEQDENGQSKVVYGTKRIITTAQKPEVHSLAADTSQADSIRKQLVDELESLYRSAGLSGSQFSMESANLSGVSRLVAQAGFFAMCSKFSKALEQFENRIMFLIADIEGVEFVDSVYSDSFSEPDLTEGISQLRDILALSVPKVIKDLMIQAFVAKYYNLTDEQQGTLDKQLNESPIE